MFSYRVLSGEDRGPVVLYIENPERSSSTDEIYKELKKLVAKSFVFCAVAVSDWDRFLTPWPAEVMQGRNFTGEGKKLLDYITLTVIPEVAELSTDIYIAGYSLAGLFSLWAIYENPVFRKAASSSGSLWYPKWQEYIENRSLADSSQVYLSLGNKEKKVKNQIMAKVEEVTVFQHSKIENSIFELNPGGHFSDVNERIVKGISRLLN